MEETKVAENKSEASENRVSAKKNSKSEGGLGTKVSGFVKGVKAEFSKIIWPTKDDIIKQTTAVVVVSAISCALIAVLDYVFGYGMNFITSIF